MNCDSARTEIIAYLKNELEAGKRKRLEEHLAKCPECRKELEQARRLLTWTEAASDEAQFFSGAGWASACAPGGDFRSLFTVYAFTNHTRALLRTARKKRRHPQTRSVWRNGCPAAMTSRLRGRVLPWWP